MGLVRCGKLHDHGVRARFAGPDSVSVGSMTGRVYLAPGASGTSTSMWPYVEGLRRRGIEATAIDIPKRKAEDAIGAYVALAPPGGGVVIGGQSYGGRVASLVAAREAYAGLVCFSYPLHRPGHPETADERIAHWPEIACPVLLLSGEADPFARIDLLRACVDRLRNAELVTYRGLGHTLKPGLEDVLDRTARFIASLNSA
jgi:pimeloyl-ACP methyl ester carboxylesterase